MATHAEVWRAIMEVDGMADATMPPRAECCSLVERLSPNAAVRIADDGEILLDVEETAASFSSGNLRMTIFFEKHPRRVPGLLAHEEREPGEAIEIGVHVRGALLTVHDNVGNSHAIRFGAMSEEASTSFVELASSLEKKDAPGDRLKAVLSLISVSLGDGASVKSFEPDRAATETTLAALLKGYASAAVEIPNLDRGALPAVPAETVETLEAEPEPPPAAEVTEPVIDEGPVLSRVALHSYAKLGAIDRKAKIQEFAEDSSVESLRALHEIYPIESDVELKVLILDAFRVRKIHGRPADEIRATIKNELTASGTERRPTAIRVAAAGILARKPRREDPEEIALLDKLMLDRNEEPQVRIAAILALGSKYYTLRESFISTFEKLLLQTGDTRVVVAAIKASTMIRSQRPIAKILNDMVKEPLGPRKIMAEQVLDGKVRVDDDLYWQEQ